MSNPRSNKSSIPEKLSSKHEIEAISLVKEEAADPEGDDDKQTKISIQLSFYNIFLLCICLYSVDVLCMIECLH